MDNKQQAVQELARRELVRRQSGQISGSDISDHPVKSFLKTFMQPVSKSLTGKSFEESNRESSLSKAGNTDFKGMNPDEVKNKLGNIQDSSFKGALLSQAADTATTPINYAISPLLKGLGIPIKFALSNVEKFSKPQAIIGLAEEVQNGLSGAYHSMVNHYGKEFEDIIGSSDKRVDITPAIKNFVDSGQDIMKNPEFAQQVAVKNPAARRVMDLVKNVTDKGVPEELDAKEANDLSKSLYNLPTIKSKLAQSNKYGFHTVQWTNEDRMILKFADDIKKGVIEEHPKLAELNKEYGTFMNAYDKVSPDFKFGQTIDRLKGYGQYDAQKKELLEGNTEKGIKAIIPNSITNHIKDYEKALKTAEFLKKSGAVLGGSILAGLGFEKGKELIH